MQIMKISRLTGTGGPTQMTCRMIFLAANPPKNAKDEKKKREYESLMEDLAQSERKHINGFISLA